MFIFKSCIKTLSVSVWLHWLKLKRAPSRALFNSGRLEVLLGVKAKIANNENGWLNSFVMLIDDWPHKLLQIVKNGVKIFSNCNDLDLLLFMKQLIYELKIRFSKNYVTNIDQTFQQAHLFALQASKKWSCGFFLFHCCRFHATF